MVSDPFFKLNYALFSLSLKLFCREDVKFIAAKTPGKVYEADEWFLVQNGVFVSQGNWKNT